MPLRLWLADVVARGLPAYAFVRLRTLLFRLAGVAIGRGTVIGGRLWIAGGRQPYRRVVVGSRCFVNDGARFDASASITIGDAVYFGHDVAIITSSHEVGDATCRARATIAEPVAIGSGSWIGARALILPGVTIGAGAIVAAGSVVHRAVEANHLVGGVPARTIRVLP